MSADDDIKAAELRGYSRGYNAGKRRRQRAITEAQVRRRESAFWQRAFIAALPFAMEQHTWTHGGKPINSLEERVRLARDVADEALNRAKYKLT